MSEMLMAGIILIITVFMFFHPRIPNGVTATVGAIMMGLVGLVEFRAVFNYYTNSACVMMIGMMIIGGGMFHTGFAGWLGRTIVRMTGQSERSIQLVAILSGWILSAVCSGSASMMILFPIFSSICLASKVSMSRVMLPMFTGIGFGSFTTVAGSGMGAATSSVLIEAGYQGWTFFEPAYFGVAKAVLCTIAIIFIGNKLLPKTYVMPDAADVAKLDDIPEKLDRKMMISGIILFATIVGMVIDSPYCPMYVCAAIGGMASVLTGCLTEKQMFKSVSWTTIFMIGGMTAVAKGIEASGLGQALADVILESTGANTPPVLIILIIFLITGIITQFMSNNAAAAIMAPIGLVIAQTMGITPYAFVAAAYFGSAIGMCTPLATPSIAFALEAGEYTAKDLMKWGLMECAVSLIVGVVVIPLVWL